jgi:mannose-6-phosphate isomerase-like protein (cupin superfamily)
MIEQIKYQGEIFSIIIRNEYSESGVNFVTPNDFSQQLAYIKHPAGKEIIPHLHNKVAREVHYTHEVLFIKKGKVRVNFYNNDKIFIESRILNKGDVILLAGGGHGFDVLEEVEMIEVKQGPYAGELDKERFTPKV